MIIKRSLWGEESCFLFPSTHGKNLFYTFLGHLLLQIFRIDTGFTSDYVSIMLSLSGKPYKNVDLDFRA